MCYECSTIHRIQLPEGHWADIETRPTTGDVAAIRRLLARRPDAEEAALAVLVRRWSLDGEPCPETFRTLSPPNARPILEFFANEVAPRLAPIDAFRESGELFAAMKRRAPLPCGYEEVRLVYETGMPWSVLKDQPWDLTQRLLVYRKVLEAASARSGGTEVYGD